MLDIDDDDGIFLLKSTSEEPANGVTYGGDSVTYNGDPVTYG